MSSRSFGMIGLAETKRLRDGGAVSVFYFGY